MAQNCHILWGMVFTNTGSIFSKSNVEYPVPPISICQWSRIALRKSAALPSLAVVQCPWLLSNLLIGSLILVASIVQFLWVPDAFATWITADLNPAVAPRQDTVGTVPASPLSGHTRYQLKNDITLWTRNAPPSAWVKRGNGNLIPADEIDRDKFFAVRRMLASTEIVPIESSIAVLGHLQYLFCLSVLNHRREREFLREWSVEVIAERVVAYETEQSKKPRGMRSI